MSAFFAHLPCLLGMSARASVLILLVLLAQRCCGRRIQPRWRYALWLLVVVRLALPWTAPSPTSLFNFLEPSAAVPLRSLSAQAAPAPAAELSGSEPSKPLAVAPSLLVVNRLAWLWAAGALFMVGAACWHHWRLQRRMAGLRPVTHGPTLDSLEDCKAEMGVAAPVMLIETGAVRSPTLFGFVRPRLLLPPGLVSGFTRDELRHVFLHELAHIRRRDIPAAWLMLALQAVHWFNPLVWLAFHRMRADRELACDALALSCAPAGENESYGLTIVKLLENFGESVRAAGQLGILEDKQQIKERINMIAKFRKADRGFALAMALVSGLALATLTDAQTTGNGGNAGAKNGGQKWDLQDKLKQADAGNQWAVYDLWDAYAHGRHGVQRNSVDAEKWLGKFTENLWIVRFEPAGDFTPVGPGDYLNLIHKHANTHSGKDGIGVAGFLRTAKKGDILVASFLSAQPEELKARLGRVPGIKVTSVDRINADQFVKYDQSEQESLWSLDLKIKAAEAGDQWAAIDLWDAYHLGNHGVTRDDGEAKKWLGKVVQSVWIVKFEPVEGFAPRNPGEFLQHIDQHSHSYSGRNNIGEAGFFRTTKHDGKLVGSFLSNYPEKLKENLAKVPGIKVTSVDQISADDFIRYEQSPQESM